MHIHLGYVRLLWELVLRHPLTCPCTHVTANLRRPVAVRALLLVAMNS